MGKYKDHWDENGGVYIAIVGVIVMVILFMTLFGAYAKEAEEEKAARGLTPIKPPAVSKTLPPPRMKVVEYRTLEGQNLYYVILKDTDRGAEYLVLYRTSTNSGHFTVTQLAP